MRKFRVVRVDIYAMEIEAADIQAAAEMIDDGLDWSDAELADSQEYVESEVK